MGRLFKHVRVPDFMDEQGYAFYSISDLDVESVVRFLESSRMRGITVCVPSIWVTEFTEGLMERSKRVSYCTLCSKDGYLQFRIEKKQK